MHKTAAATSKGQEHATATTMAAAQRPSQAKENELGKHLEAAIFPNAARSDMLAEKNKQIASLQQELAEERRKNKKYQETNSEVIQKYASLHRNLAEALSQNALLKLKVEEQTKSLGILEGKNQILSQMMFDSSQKHTSHFEELQHKTAKSKLASPQRSVSFASSSKVHENNGFEDEAVQDRQEKTSETIVQPKSTLQIGKFLQKNQKRRKSPPPPPPSPPLIIAKSVQSEKPKSPEHAQRHQAVASTLEPTPKIRIAMSALSPSKSVKEQPQPHTLTSDNKDQVEPIDVDDYLVREKENIPPKKKKRRKNRAQQNKKNSPQSKQGAKRQPESSPNQAQKSMPPSTQREEENTQQQSTAQRSKRQRAVKNYAEPSVHSKLRRGDKFTFGIDQTEVTQIYKQVK